MNTKLPVYDITLKCLPYKLFSCDKIRPDKVMWSNMPIVAMPRCTYTNVSSDLFLE